VSAIRPSELRPVDLKRKPRSAVGKGLPRHRGAADDSGAPLDLGGIRHFEEQHLGASRSQAPDKLLDPRESSLDRFWWRSWLRLKLEWRTDDLSSRLRHTPVGAAPDLVFRLRGV
jgi:hypothetical protein